MAVYRALPVALLLAGLMSWALLPDFVGFTNESVEELDRALAAGFEAMMPRELRADEAVFSSMAAVMQGGRYLEWADTLTLTEGGRGFNARFQTALWVAHASPPVRLPPLPVPGAAVPSLNVNPEDPSDNRIAAGLFLGLIRCVANPTKRGGRLLQRSAQIPGRGGYVPPHQLALLVMGLTQGCVRQVDVEEIRALLATRIYSELLADERITDLNLERMAVLCYVNLCDWVDGVKVKAILDAQQPSGMWLNLMEPGRTTDEHATAFALYVLARKRWERSSWFHQASLRMRSGPVLRQGSPNH